MFGICKHAFRLWYPEFQCLPWSEKTPFCKAFSGAVSHNFRKSIPRRLEFLNFGDAIKRKDLDFSNEIKVFSLVGVERFEFANMGFTGFS